MIKKLLKKYNDIPIAAKAALWFMFCSVVQKSISLITTPIFTRIMTTTQYGQFSVYNSWLQIFTIITTLRLNYAVFNKGMSKYKNDRDAYTSTMQSVTFLITTAVFLIYLVFHNQINALTELPTFIMVAMFAELLVTPAIDFWTIRKRYEYIYKPVVIRTLLLAFLNAGIGVIAVLLSEEKGYARIMTCILVNFCFGVTLFVYNLRKGKRLFVKEYAVFAITFNIPLLLHYFSQYILDQFDRIMIQKMVGLAAAGLYGVAYNAGLLMKIITTNLNNTLIPWLYGNLEKKEFKKIDDTMFLIFSMVAVCSVMFSTVAPEIIRILADEKYYEAVYVIPPVALGMFFNFMYLSFAGVEFYYDQNKFSMYISMAGAALNIGLNYIGINMFGYVAAAYTTLICYVVFSLSHYLYMTVSIKKVVHLPSIFNGMRLLALSAAVLVSGIIVIFLYDKIVVRYILMGIVCLIAYIKRDSLKGVFSLMKKKS